VPAARGFGLLRARSARLRAVAQARVSRVPDSGARESRAIASVGLANASVIGSWATGAADTATLPRAARRVARAARAHASICALACSTPSVDAASPGIRRANHPMSVSPAHRASSGIEHSLRRLASSAIKRVRSLSDRIEWRMMHPFTKVKKTI
jgi:hypothetical protein